MGNQKCLVHMGNEELEKELAFAEGFNDPEPVAQSWLSALRAEDARRKREQQLENAVVESGESVE
jgi:hypothetical protein